MQQKKIRFLFAFICCFLLSFQIGLSQVPRLRSPENGRVTGNSEVMLRWALIGSTQFEVQVAENSSFTLNTQTFSGLSVSHLLLQNLLPGTSYYWRVKSTQPSGNFSPYWSFSVFRPTQIDSCQLWLRADTGVTLDAGLVSTWLDSSPNQIVVSQTNPVLQPSLLNPGFNNLPALNFDGTDRFIVPNVNFGDDNTGFIIGKNTPGANPFTRVFIGGYNYNFDFFPDACQIQIGFITTGAHNADTLSQLTLLRQTGNARAFKNGTQSGPTYTNALTTMAPGNFYIGNRNDFARPLFGQISEILIYNVALPDADRIQIENYLMWKYTPELFLGNDTILSASLCPFTLSASGEFNRFLWSTGDTTSTIQVPASGSYSLAARDYFGRWHQDTIVVNFPQINQAGDITLCVGNSFSWSSNVSPALTTVWSNGVIGPSLSIDTAGFYSYEISDANGCSLASDTIEVSLDNFSQVGTLGNDTALCQGNLLTLLNQTAPLSSVLWSTGENTEQIPIQTAGTYWVQAINTNNCIVNDTINITIGGIAPQVDFSFTTVCEGSAVDFTDLSVAQPGEVLTAWEWDFGNGNLSTNQNPSFVFPDSGSFQVTLKAIVNTGCANISTKQVEVIAYPKANFYTLNVCDNSLAEFFDISNAYNGQISTWLWDFGDPGSPGNQSTQTQGQHLFSVAGNYNVSLIVGNLQGCSDTLIKPVNVKPSPVAEILTLNPCEREATAVVDVTPIPFPWELLQRQWTLWNGALSGDLMIEGDSLLPGNYPLSLFILASNGCSDTLQQILEVFPHPEASFNVISPCLGTQTQLESTSQCNGCTVVEQHWVFNQQALGDSLIQAISISDTTTQEVLLAVVNNHGCADTLIDYFEPGIKPVADFSIINPVVGIGDAVLLNNNSSGANSYSWDFGNGLISGEINPEVFYQDTGIFTIQLIALNNLECAATLSQEIRVRPRSINVSIEKLSYRIKPDGFIQPMVRIRNLGTRIERKMDIQLSAVLESNLREEWTGMLLPGQSEEYYMNSSFTTDTALKTFFCIDLLVPGPGEDIQRENNSGCLNFGTEQNLVVGQIFPNPSPGSFTLPVISADVFSCQILIIDNEGKTVMERNAELNPGLNLIKIDAGQLSASHYTLLVQSGGNQSQTGLIISKTGQ